MKTIYLDNAATTWPKPESVIRAVRDAMRFAGGNPGRGSHRLANAAAELVYDCRSAAAEFFGGDPERVVFTGNATHALNCAIKGLAEPGCHILIDNYAHNAVYRPVRALADAGLAEFDLFDASGEDDEILENIRRMIRPDTRIIVGTHQSNIGSRVLPAEKIGALCAELDLHFILDASQSAGHLPVNLEKMHITALCMPGHKGLFGPMGVGMLLSAPGVRFRTLLEGGAGIHSLDPAMPAELPERLEAGTLPLPAIAGLLAGIRYVRRIGTQEIHRHECALTGELLRRLNDLTDVTVYGGSSGSVVTFNVRGYSPAETGAYLASRGICVRTGYHCAPLAHRTAGSFENGSVRAGFSWFNKMSDVRALADALSSLCRE